VWIVPVQAGKQILLPFDAVQKWPTANGACLIIESGRTWRNPVGRHPKISIPQSAETLGCQIAPFVRPECPQIAKSLEVDMKGAIIPGIVDGIGCANERPAYFAIEFLPSLICQFIFHFVFPPRPARAILGHIRKIIARWQGCFDDFSGFLRICTHYWG
jgi:hypothetical protein